MNSNKSSSLAHLKIKNYLNEKQRFVTMDEFKSQVKKGFASCKQDITALDDQNKIFSSKLLELEQENKNLKSELLDMKSLLLEIKQTLTSRDVKDADAAVSPESQEVVAPRKTVSSTSRVSEPQTLEDPYEALLAFKAKVNKKDVLKQKMMSMIGEMGLNLSELKFMFVDHFKYCSKATFYNYLKELELEHIVRIERHHSKNIIYLEGMRKEI